MQRLLAGRRFSLRRNGNATLALPRPEPPPHGVVQVRKPVWRKLRAPGPSSAIRSHHFHAAFSVGRARAKRKSVTFRRRLADATNSRLPKLRTYVPALLRL